MTDPEGHTYSVGSVMWYDDGHSVDGSGVPVWTHGTVTGFNTTNTVVIITPDGGGSDQVPAPKVHQNKPPNPPDR